MNALDHLSSQLALSADVPKNRLREASNIDSVLKALEQHVKAGSKPYEPRELMVEAVRRFWTSLEFDSLRDARLVSFGLGLRPREGAPCLMEDTRRFNAVLSGVDRGWGDTPRQFRKCYQGLVRSYFDYDAHIDEVAPEGKKNWGELREYLHKRAPKIVAPTANPDWVTFTTDNRALFSISPCANLAQELLDGRTERLDQAKEQLGVTDASWFMRELVLAQIDKAVAMGHEQFSALTSRLLRLLATNTLLRDEGLKRILNRYCRIPYNPLHQELRNYAVEWWGNPWLPSNTMRWGGVDAPARAMVSEWLKLEFIELFFTKMQQDGIGDRRRVNFWAKYVKAIDQIHFALGSEKMYSRERDFVELRNKLKGLLVPLEDSNPQNNAFIMMMGDLVAVEFSGASNAFYGYSIKNQLPFDLSKPVRTPVDGRNSLKNSSRILYLRHQDNILGYADWEDRFAKELNGEFGIRPGTTSTGVRRVQSTPTFTQGTSTGSHPPRTETTEWTGELRHDTAFSMAALKHLAQKFRGTIEDRTQRGGALWLIDAKTDHASNKLLVAWGFKYKAAKGWWKDIRE